jgi:hypothetical protein
MSSSSEASAPISRVAVLATPQAEKYRKQLCKHFAHKLAVTEDETSGLIPFSIGDCRVESEGDRLTLTLTSPSEAEMIQLEDVVARHLVRFAFREDLAIEWRPV